MSKEVTPAWGIETYTEVKPFNNYVDNNVVKIQGKVFDTYIPCEFAQETQMAGGLGMMDQVVFTEAPDKLLPQELKNGTMAVSDVWIMMVPGKGYKP